MTPDVSVIIVNWNSRDYLRSCLGSLGTTLPAHTVEVIVIDSGSFDGADELVRMEFPDVTYVQSVENLGFARANNRAARQARGAHLLFLNPDTELHPGAIEAMLQVATATEGAGAVGARLLNTDGSVQSICVQPLPTIFNRTLNVDALRSVFPNWTLWGNAALHAPAGAAADVDVVSGACLLVSRTAYERVEGFSEDYFMYAEDVDLSWKLSLAGYRNRLALTATVVHHGGSSSGQAASGFQVVMSREATYRLLRKMRGPTYSAAYAVVTALAALLRLLLLAVALPPLALAGRLRGARTAMAKWWWVFRWAVGQEPITTLYYGHTTGIVAPKH